MALNCDGVDDAGPLTVMRGTRYSALLASAVRRAVEGGAASVRVRRIPPGLLVDAVALAASGWDALTVSKGDLATLRRVHSVRDDLAHLRGEGLDEAARLLAALARLLADPGRT